MSKLRRIIAVGAAGLAVVLFVTRLAGVATSRAGAPSDSESDQLADLERRVGELESGDLFTVVNDRGKKVFSITSANSASTATIFNSSEVALAFMGATASGAYFEARAADGSWRATLSADENWAGLRLMERVTENVNDQGATRQVTSDVARIELGRRETGNYALRFPAKSGEPIAGIGESKAGSGAIVVGDPDGKRRAAILVGDDGKGIIGIYNTGGNAILAFGEAVGNGGGALAIGDAKSEPRVKMGTKDNRYGVVMALPQGLPYVPKSGLPGSYMLGCAGGSACVP